MACDPLDLTCKAAELAKSALGGAIEDMATAVSEAVGKVLASLGTMWVNVGTPNLTGGGSSSAVGTPPGVAGLSTVLGYVTWVALALMIVSLFILGAQWAIRMRRGDGGGVGKLGVILGATVLVSAAAALVSAVLPSSPRGGSSTVAFLQGSLWWYVGAAAVLSVIVGATRMAWEQRAEPGRDLLKSLFTLIVVAGASVTVIGLLVTAADAFAVWILNNATSCDVTDDACFSRNIITLLNMAALAPAGSLLVIILGLVAILASAVQILLMVARGGMLVILTGILPLAASATNTEMGKAWFKKALGWLIAFILYKPAAAIVYATAFKLVGTDVFQDDGTGVISVLTGLMLMLVALFAMPALMRFVTPLVAATSSGGGGLAAAGAAGGLVMLPTGAAALGRLSAGHSSTASSGQVGPTGNTGGPGGTGNTGASGSDGSVGSTGTSGPPPPPPGGSAAVGVASRGGGAAAAGGAAGAGAATGSTAAAGAAAGPGVAGGVALGAAQAVGRAASGTARSVGAEATGEGDGPSGSR